MVQSLTTKLLNSNKIEMLTKRSENVFSIFSKTMNDLKQINSEIQTEKEEKQRKVLELTNECDALQSVHSKNESMINKINQFIN